MLLIYSVFTCIFASLYLFGTDTSQTAYHGPVKLLKRRANGTHCALLFFGLVKEFQVVLPSINEYILQHNPECDVYAHTYNITSVTNKRNHEKNAPIRPYDVYKLTANVELDKMEAFHDAKNVSYYRQFFPTSRRFNWAYPTSMDNMIKQWYSIERVWGLMRSAEKKKKCTYDRVGLFRLDVVYLNAINIGDANEKAVTPRAIGKGEMNDRMFYGSRSNANVWATQRFDNVERYVQKYKELWSESFLRFLFRNIRVKERHICFKRIRADGRVEGRDKKRYERDASCFTSTSTESKVETNVKSSKINVAVFGCAFGAKAQAAAKQIMKTKRGN